MTPSDNLLLMGGDGFSESREAILRSLFGQKQAGLSSGLGDTSNTAKHKKSAK